MFLCDPSPLLPAVLPAGSLGFLAAACRFLNRTVRRVPGTVRLNIADRCRLKLTIQVVRVKNCGENRLTITTVGFRTTKPTILQKNLQTGRTISIIREAAG